MLHTSNINNSSFIRPSASMPSLDLKRDLTVEKTTQGRSIQQTETSKLFFINKVKNSLSRFFSSLMFQCKAKMAPINRVDNSLALLRSEFEQKLAEKEATITSLQQAYDKNHEHISRSLRKILAVSDNLSDLQQRSEAKWLEIEARLQRLEQHISDSKPIEERSTRAGSLKTLSSMSSAEGQALTASDSNTLSLLALPAGLEQLARREYSQDLLDNREVTGALKKMFIERRKILAEQMLGNPYDLLRNSAKQNNMELELAKSNLPRELLERFKDLKKTVNH